MLWKHGKIRTWSLCPLLKCLPACLTYTKSWAQSPESYKPRYRDVRLWSQHLVGKCKRIRSLKNTASFMPACTTWDPVLKPTNTKGQEALKETVTFHKQTWPMCPSGWQQISTFKEGHFISIKCVSHGFLRNILLNEWKLQRHVYADVGSTETAPTYQQCVITRLVLK